MMVQAKLTIRKVNDSTYAAGLLFEFPNGTSQWEKLPATESRRRKVALKAGREALVSEAIEVEEEPR